MTELKRCPFCGAEAKRGRIYIRDDDGDYYIGCSRANDSHDVYVYGKTEEEAVRLWNQRVVDERLEDDLK